MKKDFLIIAGQKRRVEANWNSVVDFCTRKGISSLTELDALAKICIDDILPLMHCCIKEGERLEGIVFEMTEDELAESINTVIMGMFMRIYGEQSKVGADGVSEKKN